VTRKRPEARKRTSKAPGRITRFNHPKGATERRAGKFPRAERASKGRKKNGLGLGVHLKKKDLVKEKRHRRKKEFDTQKKSSKGEKRPPLEGKKGFQQTKRNEPKEKKGFWNNFPGTEDSLTRRGRGTQPRGGGKKDFGNVRC